MFQMPSHCCRMFLLFQKLLLVLTLAMCTSCAGMKDVDGSTLVIDRKDVRSWNPVNLWAECANAPNHYFPRGIKKGTRLDEEHGRWVVDPVDDARFYIPNDGTPGHSRESLEHMAQNATNRMSKKMIALYLPLEIALGALGGFSAPH